MILNLITKAKELFYKNGQTVEGALDEVNESLEQLANNMQTQLLVGVDILKKARSVTQPTEFYYNAQCTNRPSPNGGFATVRAHTAGSTYEIDVTDVITGVAYKNVYVGGKWNGWEKVAANSDLAKYLPLTGGTVTSGIIADGGENGIAFTAKNNLAEVRLFATSAGECGVYDMTHSKWLTKSDKNGNVTVNGTASGNLPLTGGSLTGNLGINTGANIAQVSLGGTEHKGALSVLGGVFGLYDQTHSKWLLTSDKTGTVTVNGTASGNLTADDFTVDGDTLILNFL